MNVFEILDTKAEGFQVPFFSLTRATAMRTLSMGLQKDAMLRDYSQDFSLYLTGSWDQASGRIVGLPDPIHVCDVKELHLPEEQQ